MDTFTIRDLREHTGDLIRDAEIGKLSLITKRGRPVFLAVPFTETLLSIGLPTALAISLYREGVLTIEKAAKIGGHSLSSFIEEVGKMGIPIVDYPADELIEELNTFGFSKKNCR